MGLGVEELLVFQWLVSLGNVWDHFEFIVSMDNGANVGYLRQQPVLSGRTSMELPSSDLCTADIPLMLVSPPCPCHSTDSLYTVTDWYWVPPLPAQGSMSQWQSEGAIARLHNSLKKKKTQNNKNKNIIQWNYCLHFIFLPFNWNHFQALFSTKLISHFHQGDRSQSDSNFPIQTFIAFVIGIF